MKRFLYILYIVLAVSIVNASVINVTTFTDGSSNFNITQNTTKEIYVGQGITAINANISFRGYTSENISCYQETANISTSCGGLATGSYDFVGAGFSPTTYNFYIYDGDWNTGRLCPAAGGACYFYINYSKPIGSIGAVWQVLRAISR